MTKGKTCLNLVVVVDDDTYYWVYLSSDHPFQVFYKVRQLFYYKVRQNMVVVECSGDGSGSGSSSGSGGGSGSVRVSGYGCGSGGGGGNGCRSAYW